ADDQQRGARAVAATVGVTAVGRLGLTGGGVVGRVVRAVDDLRRDVVVPAVGVVVGDDDRGRRPELGLLQLVDLLREEGLLVQRVGVARVTVLVLARLEVADGRQVPRLQRGVEVGQVVLVVGLVGVADGLDRRRRQVLRV